MNHIESYNIYNTIIIIYPFSRLINRFYIFWAKGESVIDLGGKNYMIRIHFAIYCLVLVYLISLSDSF